ncbi:hypothetical protein [Sphingomonas sp. MMS24-J13]|uniref:hypothetical protein n=1 Tax=Sphingomonas sp. MMS24-J13 TaxID=3238686 RepID=UPI00384B9685
MKALVAAATMMLAAPAMAAEKPACDRSCLEGFMTAYLGAIVAHDPARIHAVPNVKYTENQALVPIGEGLWKSLRAIGTYRILASDIRNQQIAFMGNAQIASGWTMLTVRLRIQDGRISEIEAIAPGAAASAGTFDLSSGAGKLTLARPAFATALRPEERRDRSQIIQAADLHYVGIERGNGDIVPFDNDCIKVENGIQLIRNPAFPSPGVSPSGKPVPNFTAMSCRDQFNTHIWDTDTITDRRYPVVDEERGIVVAFAMYNQYVKGPCANVVDYGTICPKQTTKPYSLAMAEAFKVRGGFIEEVESIFTVLPVLMERGVW